MPIFHTGLKGAPWWARWVYWAVGVWPFVLAMVLASFANGYGFFLWFFGGTIVTALWTYWADHSGFSRRFKDALSLDDRDVNINP